VSYETVINTDDELTAENKHSLTTLRFDQVHKDLEIVNYVNWLLINVLKIRTRETAVSNCAENITRALASCFACLVKES
jgi:hypothetical protein